jgi:uncharacterized membrane protein YheB (UPF0754 family)
MGADCWYHRPAVPDLLYLFLTVPTITAVIGWVTNWAAVKMIFWPEQWKGVGPLGWQAILFRHGNKFATGVADMVVNNLATSRELASRLEPHEIEALLAPALDRHNPELCREVTDLVMPGAWEKLPEPVRAAVLAQMRSKNGPLIREIVERLQSVADELLDLHRLVFDQLSGENTRKLARLTKRIARVEFKFIEWSGGVFGLLIGLIQIAGWQLFNVWWTLPVVGAIVGLGTNYLAIEMIFRPHEPRRYLGLFRYQGLFPKRQRDIAADYGDTARREILTPQNVIGAVESGPAAERIAQLVRDTIRDRLASEWDAVKASVPVPVPPDLIDRAADVVMAHLTRIVPEVRPAFEHYMEEKLEVDDLVQSRLGSLSKAQFERVLRGIFEEDELTLILVGGFLGGAVGVLQAGIVLAGVG